MRITILIILIFILFGCKQQTCPPCPQQIDYTKLYDSLKTELAKATKIAQEKVSADSASSMSRINAKGDSLNSVWNHEMDSVENEWDRIRQFKTDTPSISFQADGQPHYVRAYFNTEFNRIVLIGH